jgi:phosphate transport system protein
MFKDLINAFRGDTLMNGVLADFTAMMEDARWMFDVIGQSLVHQRDPEENKQQVYDRDIRLNQSERSIRKRIIQHLTISPHRDLGTSLVLFSVAKDAERLGDYCKNLQELALLIHGRAYPVQYAPRLQTMHGDIAALFEATSKAFSSADVAAAEATMESAREISRACDQIVEEIMASETTGDARNAVAVTMTVRYYKRVTAHLSNIASGVVNPVHKIDFYKPDGESES